MSSKNQKQQKLNPMAKLAQERVKLRELQEAEELRLRLEEEKRIQEEEAERQRKEGDILERRALERAKRLAKKERQISSGTYKTNSEKKRDILRQTALSRTFTTSQNTIKKETIVAKKGDFSTDLRSIIVAVTGHVDTGKTTLLDKIRHTNIQNKEVAGITQQIGASFKSREQLARCDEIEVPGLLFIDTPGHAAFTNLRERGVQICDIAILVVDITGGIEKGTLESIEILKEAGVPFVIALNKVDRIYKWDPSDRTPISEKLQMDSYRDEFESRFQHVAKDFYNLEMNPVLYTSDNTDDIIVCPVSGVTGEGIDDLLFCCIDYCQRNMREQITWTDEFEAVILESKRDTQDGVTLDVIVINGELTIGEKVGLSTQSGPVRTEIRNLMLPGIGAEMRMTSNYTSVSSVRGATGVKILASGIEGALPGTPLVKLYGDEEFETYENTIVHDKDGVTVFAPSIGQLEALLSFLREECTPPIKVSHTGIGNVFRKNLHGMTKYKEKNDTANLALLCFDVELEPDAREYIAREGIRVFTNATIYRLYEEFKVWHQGLHNAKDRELRKQAIFPCDLSILPRACFRKTNPMILGIKVEEGSIKIGIPLCLPNGTTLGIIQSMRRNDLDVPGARKGEEVSIVIDTTLSFDRHLKFTDHLYSRVTRQSIDLLKENFKDEVTSEEWKLCVKIKKILAIA